MPDPIEFPRWLDPTERAALHARVRALPNSRRQATGGWLAYYTLRIGPPLFAALVIAAAVVAARS
jgi:hypothetical protein